MTDDAPWLRMLLRRRTGALHRVATERDTLRQLITKAAQLERAGWTVYKLRGQGDELVRPSAIITAAEGETDDH